MSKLNIYVVVTNRLIFYAAHSAKEASSKFEEDMKDPLFKSFFVLPAKEIRLATEHEKTIPLEINTYGFNAEDWCDMFPNETESWYLGYCLNNELNIYIVDGGEKDFVIARDEEEAYLLAYSDGCNAGIAYKGTVIAKATPEQMEKEIEIDEGKNDHRRIPCKK